LLNSFLRIRDMSQLPTHEYRSEMLLPDVMESNYTDTNSETESISEEGRVRKLFTVCDADGDGFIDSNDLIAALQHLGLDGAINVGELMQQMGVDATGKVSYEQFLQCRLSHESEIDALRIQTDNPDIHQTKSWNEKGISSKELTGLYRDDGLLAVASSVSEHSQGAASGRHESWEFDSGACDLISPEPDTLYKLIEAAGGSLKDNASKLLEMANKIHLSSLGSLKADISELHSRLQRAAHDRDTLEQALAKTQLERLRLVQESEERLERQSSQYEERLTELHGVIAELTRKLNRQQYNVINEEGEEAEDDDEKATSRSRSNPDLEEVEPEIEPALAEAEAGSPIATDAASNRVEQVGYNLLGHHEEDADLEPETCSSCSSDLSFGQSSSDENDGGVEETAENPVGEDDLDAKAVQAGENLDQFVNVNAKELEKHLAALSVENEELKRQSRLTVQDLHQARSVIQTLRTERDEFRRKLETAVPAQQSQPSQPQPSQPQPSQPQQPQQQQATSQPSRLLTPNFISPIHRVASPVIVEEGPVCKVAERVRIKRLDARDKLLTGSQIASFGIQDPRVAEQLVSFFHQDSVRGEAHNVSGAESIRVNELELEVERLASRSEHLRAQNDVLAMTLAESRALGERLAVVLGKYEANCTVLRLALEFADRISEAFEVLAALVESEMSLLLANCQVAGIGLSGGRSVLGQETANKDCTTLWKRATERRRTAENLARCLLTRHERDTCQDNRRNTNTTSSTSSGAESGSGSGSNPGTSLEPTERKVRDIITKLKVDRASLECTIQQVSLPLESVLVDPMPKDMLPLADARKMDLEMAVIMQELMAMREERSRLRTQVYILEKERVTNEAKQKSSAVHLKLLQNQLENSEGAVEIKSEVTEAEEWTPRERRLQIRIQELLSIIERTNQNSEARIHQSAELVNDVKKANATLVQLLEKTKKKYQMRLKRLEQQMVNMSERHAIQVRVLKQRFLLLEDSTTIGTHSANTLSSAPSETSL